MKVRVALGVGLTVAIIIAGFWLIGFERENYDLARAHGAVAVANGVQSGDASQVIAGRALQQHDVAWPLIVLLVVAAIGLVWVVVLCFRPPARRRGVPPLAVIALLFVPILLAACGSPAGAKKIRQVPISASETAFVVDANLPADQKQLQAGAFVQERAILTGQVPITYEYYKVYDEKCIGCGGKWGWRANNFVYLLDRAPVTREWTNTSGSGTSASNQAFALKSVDDIAYDVQMNCTGQVAEQDAARFLSIYGGTGRNAIDGGTDFKDLPPAVFLVGAIALVMDNNVRGELQGRLSAAFGPLTVADGRAKFGQIITNTVHDVTADFAKNGLTLLNCGAVGGFAYADPKVQEAASNVAVAQQQAQAQAITNQKNVEQAAADAKATKARQDQELQFAQTLATELRDNPQVAQYITAQKWDGHAPTTVVGGNAAPPFIQVGNK